MARLTPNTQIEEVYITGFRSSINGGLVPGGTWRQNDVGLTSMRPGGMTLTHHRCLRHHK